MSDNLYRRVRQLPDRIATARKRLAKIESDDLCHRPKDYARKLFNARNRLRSLENEARQFNFFDLIEDND